ncbi:DNA primase catalytic subunit PriS [Caldiplasma sukawensis]
MEDEVIKKFREYYVFNSQNVYTINLKSREIGYIPFDGTMIRHRSFSTPQSLHNFLEKTVPRHLYHSAATYDDPSNRDMKKKGWTGAELIFDLDADHIPNADKMSYQEMLKTVKIHTKRLIEKYLEGYLGIPDKKMDIYFSGGRGYHIHVYGEDYYDMDSDQRREITNLVRLEGLNTDEIISGLKNIPENGKGILSELWNDISQILSEEKGKKWLDDFKDGKIKEKLNSKLYKKIDETVREYVKKNACEIDEPVSTDIHRLIRFPNSLHGKTGFQVKKIPREQFDNFDPLEDAIPEIFLKENMKIQGIKNYEIRLRGENFKIEKQEIADLPTYAAIFFVLSGNAKIH